MRWRSNFPGVFFNIFSYIFLHFNKDDAEVQNGITVLPLKLLAFTKVSTGQAAISHHIG